MTSFDFVLILGHYGETSEHYNKVKRCHSLPYPSPYYFGTEDNIFFPDSQFTFYLLKVIHKIETNDKRQLKLTLLTLLLIIILNIYIYSRRNWSANTSCISTKNSFQSFILLISLIAH